MKIKNNMSKIIISCLIITFLTILTITKPSTTTANTNVIQSIEISTISNNTLQNIQTEQLTTSEQNTTVTNRWNITLNNDEKELLACILWLEARGEDDTGEQAVIEVIFNRMIHPEFAGTLYEVISRPQQFSSFVNIETAEPTKREFDNIEIVLSNQTNILNNDKVYFSIKPQNDINVVNIGNHTFCDYE